MYKVFYNNSAILIGELLTKKGMAAQTVVVPDKRGVFLFLDNFLSQDRSADVSLSGYKVHVLFADLKSYFQYLEAAGGLVRNNLGEYLFIRRWGIWDLPKGKMEKYETAEETAIREVAEETGVSGIRLSGIFPATYHIYQRSDMFVLKKTHWFSMRTSSHTVLHPQTEEEITEAVWLDKEKSKQAIQTTYRSLKENFLPLFED